MKYLSLILMSPLLVLGTVVVMLLSIWHAVKGVEDLRITWDQWFRAMASVLDD